MLNVHNSPYEIYETAPPLPKRTFSFWAQLCLGTFVDVLKLPFIFASVIFQSIVKFFDPNAVKNVNGKVALITGGANGIGKYIAIELAKKGCNLAIADINNNEMIKTVKELSELYDVKCVGFNIDVADYTQIDKLKAFVYKNLGPVDILINNAGLLPDLSLRGGDPRDLERIINVNLNGSIYMTQAFINDMMERRSGHIVQISSSAGCHALPGAVTYTSTKFGLIGFMHGIEQELRLEGFGDVIQFTTAYPYFVSTRKDLMKVLNLRYPAISVEDCSQTIVNGILRNKRTIFTPRFLQILIAVLVLVPYPLQCVLRDVIMREKETKVVSKSNTSE